MRPQLIALVVVSESTVTVFDGVRSSSAALFTSARVTSPCASARPWLVRGPQGLDFAQVGLEIEAVRRPNGLLDAADLQWPCLCHRRCR